MKFSGIHSIIVPAANANVSAHTYTEVYGGNSGCTITINGQTVNIGGSSSIEILVRTVTGGTGCFLLGDNKDVYTGIL